MIDKNILKNKVEELLGLTKARNSNQGLVIYNLMLKDIDLAVDDVDLRNLLKSFCGALGGIEAHGFFTDEEYELVTYIRSLV